MAKIGEIFVKITGRTKGLDQSIDKSQKKLSTFGKAVKQLGTSLAGVFAVGVIARWGAQLAKSVVKVEANFTKLETLVGLTNEQAKKFRGELVGISKISGRSMTELSDALFTVTSAGIRGAEAMDIMERSAKAAAIGLGETKAIAKSLTAVLQAYGTENINAARATEILIATVREGNLEASELAPTLGRVIGIASQLGISFEEVGASVATFTRLGVDTTEAIVGLRGIMNALLNTSPDVNKELGNVGKSLSGLRKEVREKGLAKTLIELVKAFGDNQIGLKKVIPDVRAFAAVMGTAAAQGDTYLEVVQNIIKENALLDTGFEKVSETTGQKFTVALNNIGTTLGEFGNDLLPLVTGALNVLTQGFRDLGAVANWLSAPFGELLGLFTKSKEIEATAESIEEFNKIMDFSAKTFRVVSEELDKTTKAQIKFNKLMGTQPETVQNLIDKLEVLKKQRLETNLADKNAIAIINDQVTAIEKQIRAIEKLTKIRSKPIIEPKRQGVGLTSVSTENLTGIAGGINFRRDIESVTDIISEFTEETDLATQAAQLFGQAMMSAFTSSAESAESFGERFKNVIHQTIKALIAVGVTQTIVKALGENPTPLALATAPIAGALAAGIFASVVPSFAKGGFVPSPTLAMIGDSPGGEFVLNQSQMKGLTGGQTVNVVGKIRGRDILLASEREQDFKNRTG